MNVVRQLVDTLSYSASADKEVKLSTDGFITRLDLECSIVGSGAMAGALAAQGLWRIIQNIKVKGAGGKNYFDMSGVQMGVPLHFLNLLDFPGISWHEIVATTQVVSWRIHFGSRPRDILGRDNPFDLSAAIPAMDESDVKLIVTWPATNAIDDTITISSATMRVTESKVQGSPAEIEAVKAGLMVPISTSSAYDPGATKSGLSGQVFIPTGNFVRRVLIAAQDNTAVGSLGPLFVADQVTELGIKLVKLNTWVVDAVRTKQLETQNPKWDGMVVNNVPNTQDPYSVPGFYMLDLRQVGESRDWGVDARALGSNDLILGMTIVNYSSTETEQIWYDQFMPYAQR